MKRNLSKWLNYSANLLLVVSFLLSGYYLLKLVSPTLRLRDKRLPGLEVGMSFPALRDHPQQHSKRVIIFADSRCNFSNESMPFFKRLATDLRMSSKDYEMILVFPENDIGAREVLQQFEEPVSIAHEEFSNFGVDRIPAIVFLNKSGQIEFAYSGRLDLSEEEVLVENILK